MKKITKLLSLMLAVLMLVGLTTAAAAAQVTFTDVSGHWAWTQGQIPYLVEKNVLNGYKQNNGTYKFMPDGEVKRSEFIKMLDETFGLVATASINFGDVKSSDWFYPYFQKAAAQGYLLDYGANANPEGKITREEAISLLVRYLALPEDEYATSTQFDDINTVASDYKHYILQAEYASLVNGIAKDGKTLFMPKKTLTRAEALTILYRAAGCIFNKTSYSRDTLAPEKNNVFTAADISLKDITFTGRNIISEGVSSGTITFTGCTFKDTLYVRGNTSVRFDDCNVQDVVVLGKGSVSLLNNTTVKSLTLNASSPVSVYSGTRVDELNVEPYAVNVTVTGNGFIKAANIKARGFTSAIIPETFEIADKITATFASNSYQGSSSAQDSFKLTPFSTRDNSMFYINASPAVSGRLYLYYTNDDKLPTASGFDANFDSSTYATSFKVSANANLTEETFKAKDVEGFSYVVLQIQDGTRKYAPVIVSNVAASGTGFSIDPHIEGTNEIELKTKTSGKLYWYYADKGGSVTVAEFIDAYNSKESALRGEESVTGSRTYSFTLKSKYLENYEYVAFMLVGSGNAYYTPVVVAVGENGFSELPGVTSPGVISFKTSVSGEVYYYYSKSDDIPDADDFNTEYRAAKYGDYVSAVTGKEGEIKYNTLYASEYPYIVLAVRNGMRDFLQPVVVSVDYDTGFSSNPEIRSGNEIRFKTEHDGEILYYYTNTASAPSASGFMTTYDKLSSRLTGSLDVTERLYGYIEYDNDYAEEYSYMALMLVDERNKSYSPVVIKLDIVSENGFDGTPTVADSKITFKTEADGEVFWYMTNSSESVSVADFYYNWRSANTNRPGISGTATARKGITGTASFDRLTALDYKYIVIAFLADRAEVDEFSFPVIIGISNGGGSSSSIGSGITCSVNGDFVTVETYLSGTVYYYLADYQDELPNSGMYTFSRCWTLADAEDKGSFSLTRSYEDFRHMGAKYVVLAFVYEGEFLPHVILDIRAGGSYDDSTSNPSNPSLPNDGATVNAYGISYTNEAYSNLLVNYEFSFTAEADGNVDISIGMAGSSSVIQTVPVQKGVPAAIKLDILGDIIENLPVSTSITLNLQLKSGTTVYKTLSLTLR